MVIAFHVFFSYVVFIYDLCPGFYWVFFKWEIHSFLYTLILYLVSWASLVALVVKNLPANAGGIKDAGLIPGSGRFPCRREWQPTPVFLPGESHELRSLADYSLCGCKELDMTEWLCTQAVGMSRRQLGVHIRSLRQIWRFFLFFNLDGKMLRSMTVSVKF